MRPHQKLLAWQESIHLVNDIYQITMSFPESEKFGITSQLRRASVSIACDIAEGPVRNSNKEFIRFLYISSGSLSEVETLLIISNKLGLLNVQQFDTLINLSNKISALLQGLIKKLKSKP